MPAQDPSPLAPPALPPAQAGAIPATGAVLIGTLGTVRSLWAQIESTCPGVVPAGCLLVEGGNPAAWSFGRLSDLPPVLGGLDVLIDLHARMRFRLALVSLPAAAGMDAALRRIAGGLTRLGIEHRIIPTIGEWVAAGGQPLRPEAGSAAAPGAAPLSPAAPLPARPGATLAPAPPMDFTQLIGRAHYGLDRRAVGAILTGKRVLITGAGGSIGSEIARVAAGFNPESLILMERAENALFNIDHELGRRFPAVGRRAVLHDVVDPERTLRLLVEHRPHVVFHAAAHKHVPLMEDHPSHAIDNNLFGTKSIADAAVAAGAERFVMISSDKAVNPTSVMGATKRLAELYVAGLARARRSQSAHTPGATRLSMVRFGNVLGSACSVIPIWSQQISEGGPITVTDPRMTRYFMTIPEAATLVAQAAALTGDPDSAPVYVLDMGEPVRILDLAVRLVRMHGLSPRLDRASLDRLGEAALAAAPDVHDSLDDDAAPPLNVVFSGSRPGEKLFEQLAYAAEQLRPTAHPGITCWAGVGADACPDIHRLIADLSSVRHGGDRALVLSLIRRHVPEMQPRVDTAAA